MGCSKPGSFAFENIGLSGETGLLAHSEMPRLEAWLISHQNIFGGGMGGDAKSLLGAEVSGRKVCEFW